MRNAGLEEAQTGIKISRRNINNLRYADETTLTAEGEEELKSRLIKVKEESEKVGLKLNIQKTKKMPSGPITSQQIYEETVETVADFIFLGSKITADGTMDWFKLGKGVHQGCILSPCLFNLYAEYIMSNAGLEEAQAGIKNRGRTFDTK